MAQVYRRGRIYYSTGNPTRLTPYEIRTREFTPRRRGVDPEQVRDFQLQVADELTDLHQAVRLLGTENDRLKRALRDWQTMHTRHCDAQHDARHHDVRHDARHREGQQDHRPNQGHW